MTLFGHRPVNKRVHTRIPFWTRVRVEVSAKEREASSLADTLGVENLSEGGMLIETPYVYPIKVPCRIFLRHNPFSDELALEGLVVRSAPSRRGDFFDTGIAFPSLTEDQREILKQMISFYTS